MATQYQHTQVGWVILGVGFGTLLVTKVFLLAVDLDFESLLGAWGVVVLIAGVLGLFATLTARVDDEAVTAWFGPGLIRRRVALDRIATLEVVQNPWYAGWGLRLMPDGWLWNVSGFDAVELRMHDGEAWRIGTDDPWGLYEAIGAISMSSRSEAPEAEQRGIAVLPPGDDT